MAYNIPFGNQLMLGNTPFIGQNGFANPAPAPAEDTVTGYDAITGTPPSGPLARRKVVRGPDGTPHVVYIDNDTGQELNTLDGYKVIEGSNYMTLDQLGMNPTEDTEPTVAEKTIRNVKWPAPERADYSGVDSRPNAGGRGRTQANNFGYFNKPGFMGFAGFLPGPAGMIGKIANAGINANNMMAANTARKAMGLEPMSLGQQVKGVFKDNVGYVADVQIASPQTIPIGFEAQTATGRTMMLPEEAMKRARANQLAMVETPKDIVKARESEFAKEYGGPTGILGRVKSTISNFVDDIFGRDSEPVYAQSDPSFAPTQGGFRDMIYGGYTGYGPTAGPVAPYTGYGPTGGGSSGGSSSGGLRAGVNNAADARGGGRGSASGGGSGGYDSVGTPSNNDSSFGGPR